MMRQPRGARRPAPPRSTGPPRAPTACHQRDAQSQMKPHQRLLSPPPPEHSAAPATPPTRSTPPKPVAAPDPHHPPQAAARSTPPATGSPASRQSDPRAYPNPTIAPRSNRRGGSPTHSRANRLSPPRCGSHPDCHWPSARSPPRLSWLPREPKNVTCPSGQTSPAASHRPPTAILPQALPQSSTPTPRRRRWYRQTPPLAPRQRPHPHRLRPPQLPPDPGNENFWRGLTQLTNPSGPLSKNRLAQTCWAEVKLVCRS